VVWNGELYEVAEDSPIGYPFGYQDKNWGRDYTSPWIWLSCNNFTSLEGAKQPSGASLVVGGGKPSLFGHSLGEKVLVAWSYNGNFYEWNFTNLLDSPKQKISISESSTQIFWDISMKNSTHRIEIHFTADKAEMLDLFYENPRGVRKLVPLWNSGTARGTVQFYERQNGSQWQLIDTLEGNWGAAEYGTN
jgi:hypothetical protein